MEENNPNNSPSEHYKHCDTPISSTSTDIPVPQRLIGDDKTEQLNRTLNVDAHEKKESTLQVPKSVEPKTLTFETVLGDHTMTTIDIEENISHNRNIHNSSTPNVFGNRATPGSTKPKSFIGALVSKFRGSTPTIPQEERVERIFGKGKRTVFDSDIPESSLQVFERKQEESDGSSDDADMTTPLTPNASRTPRNFQQKKHTGTSGSGSGSSSNSIRNNNNNNTPQNSHLAITMEPETPTTRGVSVSVPHIHSNTGDNQNEEGQERTVQQEKKNWLKRRSVFAYDVPDSTLDILTKKGAKVTGLTKEQLDKVINLEDGDEDYSDMEDERGYSDHYYDDYDEDEDYNKWSKITGVFKEKGEEDEDVESPANSITTPTGNVGTIVNFNSAVIPSPIASVDIIKRNAVLQQQQQMLTPSISNPVDREHPVNNSFVIQSLHDHKNSAADLKSQQLGEQQKQEVKPQIKPAPRRGPTEEEQMAQLKKMQLSLLVILISLLFFYFVLNTRYQIMLTILDTEYNVINFIFGFFSVSIIIPKFVPSFLQAVANMIKWNCSCSKIKRDSKKNIIILTPVYNEGKEEMLRTVQSVVLAKKFDPELNMVHVLILDGIETDQQKETLTQLKEILQLEDPENSSAKHTIWKLGKLNFDHYQSVVEGVEFRLLVKPMNRGKRNSQMVWYKYICDRVAFPNGPEEFEYSLFVDSDTRFDANAVTLLYEMLADDDRVAGCCGEVIVDKISRGADRVWKWAQYFEYKVSHYWGKASESAYGMVSCLPGAFCMYRTKCLLDVEKEFCMEDVRGVWKKNMMNLGEDRYLTVLVLRKGFLTKFEPRSKAYTITPSDPITLITQRRRWNNSSFVNYYMMVTSWRMWCSFNRKLAFLLMWTFIVDIIIFIVMPAAFAYTMLSFALIIVDYFQVDNTFVYPIFLVWLIIQVVMATMSNLAKNKQMQTSFRINAAISGTWMILSVIGTIYAVIKAADLGDVNGVYILYAAIVYMGLLAILGVVYGEIKMLLAGIPFIYTLPTMFVMLPLYSVLNFDEFSWGR